MIGGSTREEPNAATPTAAAGSFSAKAPGAAEAPCPANEGGGSGEDVTLSEAAIAAVIGAGKRPAGCLGTDGEKHTVTRCV